MLNCDHHRISLSVRIEKKKIHVYWTEHRTYTEPVNCLSQLYWTRMSKQLLHSSMTSLTSYELHSNILFILLDGIQTQDLVGGALTFSCFYRCTIGVYTQTFSLINIYLSLWDPGCVCSMVCHGRSIIEPATLHVSWVHVMSNSKKFHTRSNEKWHIKNDTSVFGVSLLAYCVVLCVHPSYLVHPCYKWLHQRSKKYHLASSDMPPGGIEQ